MNKTQIVDMICMSMMVLAIVRELSRREKKQIKYMIWFCCAAIVAYVSGIYLMKRDPIPLIPLFLVETGKILVPGFIYYRDRKSTRLPMYVFGYLAFFRLINGILQTLPGTFERQMGWEKSGWFGQGLGIQLLSLLVVLLIGITVMRIRCLERIPYKIYAGTVIGLFLMEYLIGAPSLNKSQSQADSIVSILYMSILLAFFVWGYLYTVQNQERRTGIVLEKVVLQQYAYYHSLKEQERDLRKIRHDLANHMQVINHLGKSCEREEYRQQFLQEVQKKKEVWEHTEAMVDQSSPILPVEGKIGRIISGILVLILILGNVPLILHYNHQPNLVTLLVCYNFLLILLVGIIMFFRRKSEEKKNRDFAQLIETGKRQKAGWRALDEQMLLVEHMNPENSGVNAAVPAITGHKVCDAMLANKRRICDGQQIQLKLMLQVPQSGINPVSIVGVMGNMLDNAIEACERQTEGKREIDLKSYMRGNFWILSMTNTMPEDAYPKADAYKTRKADPGAHGFGLQIMREITETYDGVMKLEQQGNLFYTQIMLRMS